MKHIIAYLGFLLLVAGCSVAPRPKQAISPTTTVAPSGEVTLKGDAKDPAKVNVKKTDGVLNLPEASRFDFNEKTGIMSLTLSKATQMVLNRTETAVEGPVAFDPPKQPTVKEVVDAKADFWTKLGLQGALVIGLFAAGFGLVRGWDLVMWGGASLALAGLFGLFVQSHPILLAIIGIGITLALVGPWIWHTKLKHLKNGQNDPEQGNNAG